MGEQELNRKLAEWRWGESYLWYPPNEPYVSQYPNFTRSLDACFKWLVPLINKKDYGVMIAVNRLGVPSVKLFPLIGEVVQSCSKKRMDDTALALCLAIEKLLGEKKEKHD